MFTKKWKNICEIVARHAEKSDTVAVRFYNEMGSVEEMTYGDLHQKALMIAEEMRSQALPGERCMILLPPSIHYIQALFGAMYAGLVPVASYPPFSPQAAKNLVRIIKDCCPAIILTTEEIKKKLSKVKFLSRIPFMYNILASKVGPEILSFCRATYGLKAIESYLKKEKVNHLEPYPHFSTDTAILLYTSGSTSEPKGVEITHGNLIYNIQKFTTELGITPNHTTVIWLPPFHTSGLCGGILTPLYIGLTTNLMSPILFLKDPLSWIEIIAQQENKVITAAPNSGYAACIKHYNRERIEGLDLSNWESAINGSEPVHAKTLDEFLACYQSHGFPADAFFPVYGITEATMYVSGGRFDERSFKIISREKLNEQKVEPPHGLEDAYMCVSVGHPHRWSDVVIVDPVTQETLEENQIGEILVGGGSIAKGYWNKPEVSREVFGLYHEGGYDRYLRTMDLGFIKDGQLFLTGRIKDLIIIHGKNFYPIDIELNVETGAPLVNPARIAAFAVEAGEEEKLVIMCEMHDTEEVDFKAIDSTIRDTLWAEFQLQPYSIVYLPPDTMGLTVTRKVARFKNREIFLSGEFPALYISGFNPARDREVMRSKPQKKEVSLSKPQEKELTFATVCEEIRAMAAENKGIPVDEVDISAPIIRLGIDSFGIVALIGEIEMRYEKTIPTNRISQNPTLEEIARLAVDPALSRVPIQEQGIDVWEFPLTQYQSELYQLNRVRQDNRSISIPVGVRLVGMIDLERMEKSLQAIVRRHYPLHSMYCENKKKYVGRPSSSWNISLEKIEKKNLEDFIARPFKLERELPVRLAVFREAENAWVVVAVFHHVAADLFSAGVFMQNILEHYVGRHEDEKKTKRVRHSYLTFVQEARDKDRELAAREFQNSLKDHHLDVIEVEPEVAAHYETHVEMVAFPIPKEDQKLLESLARDLAVTPYVLWVTALALWGNQKTGERHLLLTATKGNRNSAQYSETIGCLANPALIVLEVDRQKTIEEIVHAVAKRIEESQASPLTLAEQARVLRKHQKDFTLPRLFFSYFNQPIMLGSGEAFDTTPVPLTRGNLDSDLFLTLLPLEGKWVVQAEYNAEVISEAHIGQAWGEILDALRQIQKHSHSTLEEIQDKEHAPTMQLHIVSSFTTDYLVPSLAFWEKQVPWEVKTSFAQYNQVMHELLNPSSTLRSNEGGVNVLLLRLEDVIHYAEGDEKERAQQILSFADELTHTLQEIEEALRSQVLVLVTPPSEEIKREKEIFAALIEATETMQKRLKKKGNIRVLPHSWIEEKYPLSPEKIHDPTADRIGHIPYTKEYFDLLGTAITRYTASLFLKRPKVLVLDCDNTLWKGVVAEEGVQGIVLNDAFRAFQEGLKALSEEGILLTLVSKNIEKDVRQVFEERDDFPLRWEDIAAHQINWEAKSENIVQLAKELNLGLDSFLFIDDNEIECEEVHSHHPEVMTFHLPRMDKWIEGFVQTNWLLDTFSISSTDKARTKMYQQEFERKQVRQKTESYADFIKSLKIELTIHPVAEENIPRASQMTLRTNQFNTTTMRIKEQEMVEWMRKKGSEIYIVHAKDRFGDYGGVGLFIAEEKNGVLHVPLLLMSCRVIGRGIEYDLIRFLGAIALRKKCKTIEIPYVKTDRNIPVRNFLDRVLGKSCTINTDAALKLEYTPDETAVVSFSGKAPNQKKIASAKQQMDLQKKVFETTLTLKELHRRIHQDEEVVAPEASAKQNADVIEHVRQTIEQITGEAVTDVTADLFEVTSLSSLDMIEAITAIETEWKCRFPLEEFLRDPTIHRAAALITQREASLPHAKEDLLKDATLPNSFTVPQERKEFGTYQNCLLLGATGYLGAFILTELLKQTDSQVTCIVRAGSNLQAKERIIENLEKYDLLEDFPTERITGVAGDLAEERFGLNAHAYKELSQNTDAVYHSAAVVNYLFPYSKMKKHNVDGVYHTLVFCADQVAKPLHYISSSVVFDAPEYRMDKIIEERSVDWTQEPRIIGGYAKTKWVAEALIEQAKKRGLPVKIYRPAGISNANNRNAFLNMHDILNTFMITCLSVGGLPDINGHINFSPVDYVARATVALSKQGDINTPYIYHLSHPHPIRMLQFHQLMRDLGVPLESLSYKEWVNRVQKYAQTNRQESLIAMLRPLFVEPIREMDHISWMEQALTRGSLDCYHVLSQLPKGVEPCPEYTAEFVLRTLLLGYLTADVVKEPDKILKGKDKQVLILTTQAQEAEDVRGKIQEGTYPLDCITVSLDAWSLFQNQVARMRLFLRRENQEGYQLLERVLQGLGEERYPLFNLHLDRLAEAIATSFEPDLIIAVDPMGNQLASALKQYLPGVPLVIVPGDSVQKERFLQEEIAAIEF